VREMYEATDRLIKALPPREIPQPTIWQECLSRADAASLVRSRATLPGTIEKRSRELLRHKLETAYTPLGYAAVVERLFGERPGRRHE